MKISMSQCSIAVLIGIVVVLSVCLLKGPDAPAVQKPEPVRAERPSTSAPSDVPGAVERALRRRIRQLEVELAAARAPAAETNEPARAEARPMPQPGDFRPPSPREMMENLKKNDPKRYEEFRTRFAQMRKRSLERTKGKLGYLASLETAGMSKAEKANHEKLQELLTQRENLPDLEDLSEEDARATMQQRRELDHAIRKASATERTTLLKQTASALGLEGDDASVLTDTIQEVIRATENDRSGPHGPPPGGAPR